MNTTRRVRFSYPPSLLDQPIMHRLIRRFELTVNIYRANVTTEAGWLILDLSGEAAEIDRALGWVTEQGVQVEDVVV